MVKNMKEKEGPTSKTLIKIKSSIDFYKIRVDAIQKYQHKLPEPHRTIICNILANGSEKS